MQIRLAAFLSDASGGIGGKNGDVIATSKGCMYLRAKGLVDADMGALSLAARGRLTSASAAWASLSDANRAKWEAWATAHPRTNHYGVTAARSGFQEFVAYHASYARAGGTSLTNFGPDAGAVRPSVTASNASATDAGEVACDLSAGTTVLPITGSYVLMEISQPVPAQQSYLPKAFRYLTSQIGNSGTPPTSITGTNADDVWPMAATVGYKFYIRLSLVLPTGPTAIMSLIPVTVEAA